MGFTSEEEGRGRHASGILAIVFYFYLKKEAPEANGQNVNIYLIFMKDMFSVLFSMLEIFHTKKIKPSCMAPRKKNYVIAS